MAPYGNGIAAENFPYLGDKLGSFSLLLYRLRAKNIVYTFQTRKPVNIKVSVQADYVEKTPKMWYKIYMVIKNKEYYRNSRFLGCFCVIILLALSGCTNVFMENLLARKEGPYTGPYGDGSPGNPFRVYDVETLIKVGTETTPNGWNKGAHYRQERDIDMFGKFWNPIGDGSFSFTGLYDGKNRTIKNLVINDSFSNLQGLFGYNSGGTLMNIRLVNYDISMANGEYIGGIVGFNTGIVKNCYATGNVYGADAVGGVVGENDSGGTVQNCYAAGNVTGDNNIGGIVGENNGTVLFCYYAGNNVSGSSYVGGVVGYNSATVKNCVALNRNINNTPPTNNGRVVGNNTGMTLAKLFAREDMKLNDGLVTWSNPGIAAADGDEINKPDHWSKSNWWITMAEFTDSWWTGKLPLGLD